MSTDVRSLRSQILRVARSNGSRKRSRRYPEALRRAATNHARCRLEQGESVGSVAGTLGLSAQTLNNWLRSTRISGIASAGGMRAVSVVPRSDTDEPPVESILPAPILITPGGLRIEGLDLASVAELVRRIG